MNLEMKTSTPQAIYLKDYTPSAFSIKETYLCFELDPKDTVVTSTLKIQRTELGGHTPLDLLGDQLTLLSISLDGVSLSEEAYKVTEDQLLIYQTPDQFTLTIQTAISPVNNKELMGLYASSGNFCTQCEAEGFRRITYYLDRPDILSVFTTKIIAEKSRYPILLSNGNLQERGEISETHHYALWSDPFPKPSYLFALVAGQFDLLSGHFTTRSGRDVEIQIYTNKGQADQCHHALKAVKKSMRWDEENYGREYDLDLFMIVAVNDFNFGAMENKGLNIFNAKYILASEQSATDSDFSGVDTVVAHEYFHNWSGNRVTLRDWFQLSLKEGFTVYRDQSFDEDNISRTVHRVNVINRLRSSQFKEDQGPMAHPVQPQSYVKIDNFYTTTIYNKGAEVIRMFHLLLGDEAYRKACDTYFKRFDGQAVTIQDFAQVMQAHTTLDLTPFLLWYSQAGTPKLIVTDDYNAEAQQYTLTIQQVLPDTAGQKNKRPMLIPIKMALITEDGEELPTPELYRGELFLLDQQEQTITFDGIEEPVVPSLLRHFSAPVKCEYQYTQEQLELLMRYDQDGVNRWQASQHLALRQLKPMIKAAQDGSSTDDLKRMVSTQYLHLMSLIFEEEVDDLYYHAQLISLPSESYLAEQMKVVDVDAVHQAHSTLKYVLADYLRTALETRYHTLSADSSSGYDVLQMGHRVLKNTCLGYLCALSEPQYIQLAMKQFTRSLSTNMTDTIAALTALSHTDTPQRVEALRCFYDQWSQSSLVMNKWLAIQASAHRSDVLEVVQDLIDHPCFSIENPNNVYALIYQFALNNPVHFHTSSGKGYHFLAQQVSRVDQINPMVAARIVVPLTHWRRYDQRRGEMMRASLEKMTQDGNMSDNLHECVTKSLLE